MAKDEHNRDVNEKLPGEKPEGTHHFNPGNQSGKSESPHVDKPTPEEKQEQKYLSGFSPLLRFFLQHNDGWLSLRRPQQGKHVLLANLKSALVSEQSEAKECHRILPGCSDNRAPSQSFLHWLTNKVPGTAMRRGLFLDSI